MRSGNPALTDETFKMQDLAASGMSTMTLNGTVNKTFIYLLLVCGTALFTWNLYFGSGGEAANITPFVLAGCIGGFIVALITIFAKRYAPYTAPVYALLEGLAIGGVSALFEQRYPGIVIQAVSLTFGTLFCLLVAYKSGWIRATENFKLGVVCATGAIAVLYLVDLGMMFFGMRIGFIHESGTMGILFSLFVVAIAALNLVLDFDFIERGVESGAPKYMESYAAFGLLVTLVWLYLEILRLLGKSRR